MNYILYLPYLRPLHSSTIQLWWHTKLQNIFATWWHVTWEFDLCVGKKKKMNVQFVRQRFVPCRKWQSTWRSTYWSLFSLNDWSRDRSRFISPVVIQVVDKWSTVSCVGISLNSSYGTQAKHTVRWITIFLRFLMSGKCNKKVLMLNISCGIIERTC